ncbi:hypothetical protein Tco_0843333 [Tanacetum coccineum]|uniref:Uncharacterized protein n=1 Tax=Tanacetum coccineum TaxID=301880 RepID=A0ABQ5B1S4_9ASTR
MLTLEGIISLMTPTQALKSIQIMAEHSHDWYDETIIRERINDSSDNFDAIQASFKWAHLTKECPLKKEDKEVEQSKGEGQDYDIPLQDGVMQPLNPQTSHITSLDDDYVAPGTNLILNKYLNEFGEEFFDNTRVSKKIDSNPVNDLKELLKTYDFEPSFGNYYTKLVPSCFVIFDLEPLSLSFDFVFASEIFKSLSFCLDRLCHLAILCLDQHAHTLHHLESLLTISLDRLDIFEGRSCISEFVRKSLSLILELS